MPEKAHLQTLFNYHWHTTQRLLDLAATLDTAVFHADPGQGRRSMQALLFHLYATDRGWRIGLQSGRQPAFPDPARFQDLGALRAAFTDEQALWDGLLADLDEAQIGDVVELTALNGGVWPLARWHVLHHVLLHGMQHHTELAQLLTEQGASPGDIDFLYYRAS